MKIFGTTHKSLTFLECYSYSASAYSSRIELSYQSGLILRMSGMLGPLIFLGPLNCTLNFLSLPHSKKKNSFKNFPMTHSPLFNFSLLPQSSPVDSKLKKLDKIINWNYRKTLRMVRRQTTKLEVKSIKHAAGDL